MHTAPCVSILELISARCPAPADAPLLPEVHLQIQRGELLVRLECPLSQCAVLLRELLRCGSCADHLRRAVVQLARSVAALKGQVTVMDSAPLRNSIWISVPDAQELPGATPVQ